MLLKEITELLAIDMTNMTKFSALCEQPQYKSLPTAMVFKQLTRTTLQVSGLP